MILCKKNKRLFQIEKSDNISYLWRRLEEIAYSELCTYQIQPEVYLRSHSGVRGYFMIHKPEKITLYKKIDKRGYICNYTELTKIISFFIVYPEKKSFSKTTCEVSYSRAVSPNFTNLENNWDAVHKELVECFSLKIKNSVVVIDNAQDIVSLV